MSDDATMITLTMPLGEVNLILNGLGKLPAELSYHAISSIRATTGEQLKAADARAAEAKADVPAGAKTPVAKAAEVTK